jgi:mannose-6-phosphate isomerase
MSAPLRQRAERARAWLFDDALPVWAEHGANPRGGFHDRLGADLTPIGERMRLRVQARQTFVFAEAGRLGWEGAWGPLVEHGLAFLLHRARDEAGLVRSEFDPDGGPTAPGPELYDQAFALFAYAQAFRALGDQRAREAALGLHDALAPFSHPRGGYREPTRAGLGANANMHLFEAVLTWAELDANGPWAGVADGLARLCAERLVNEEGALREHFDDDWRPAEGARGTLTEPGHHYEWAWLLRRSGRPAAELAGPLCRRAERAGVDPARRVAINEVDVEGHAVDGQARLWPQTERLRAAVALTKDGGAEWEGPAVEAFDSLFAYIEPAPPGLWYDLMDEDGRIAPEPSPASSFYHVVGALSELIREYGPW